MGAARSRPRTDKDMTMKTCLEELQDCLTKKAQANPKYTTQDELHDAIQFLCGKIDELKAPMQN